MNLKIIITIFVGTLLFTFLGWKIVQSYTLTSNLSSDGGAMVDEINGKIKQLQDDSSNAYTNLLIITKLEKLVSESIQKIGEKRDLILKGYTFKTSDYKTALRFVNDSVYNNDFNNYLSFKLRDALKELEGTSALYSQLYDNSIYGLNADDNYSLNSSYLKNLSSSYFTIFNIPFNSSNNKYYYKISDKDVQSLLSQYNTDKFSQSLNSWTGKLQAVASELIERENGWKKQDEMNFSKIQQLKKELVGINGLGRDKTIITIALPVFAVLIIILFVIPYIYRFIKIQDEEGNQSNVMVEIFSKGLLLKIFTVFLLTIAIILLALGDKIQGETIGTLLGGISVYILQSSFGRSDDNGGTT